MCFPTYVIVTTALFHNGNQAEMCSCLIYVNKVICLMNSFV